jgi:hypothetical protein
MACKHNRTKLLSILQNRNVLTAVAGLQLLDFADIHNRGAVDGA